MVLTDDNFASIVNAVEEGRGIFDNIQKFIHYLLATNAGEVLLLLFAAIVGWPVPLVAAQILWINLVTDGFPALALGMEPPEPDIMERKPRHPRESVITWRSGLSILIQGVTIAAVAIVGFWIVYQGDQANLGRARAATFCNVAFSQLFFVFACRSQRYTLPELGLFTNPYLFVAVTISALLQMAIVTLPLTQGVFEIAAPVTWDWLPIILLALIPVTLVEVTKIVLAHFRPKA